MLFGSLNAGLAFANSGVSVAHALQFAIGAATGTPHGLGTGMMLPYVMAFNRPAREPELAELAAALGEPGGDAVAIVHALGLRIGLPARLADLELAEERLEAIGEQAAGIRRLAGNNPRPVDAGGLHRDPPRRVARGPVAARGARGGLSARRLSRRGRARGRGR